jgi:6-phosphogluconolactonase/glucosamine-6-phosphate isomerase/deaminase
MKIEILADADAVARKSAEIIAAEAQRAVAARGRFVMVVSGGHTAWQMLRGLANEQVPWGRVQVVQMDDRVAPAGDPDRKLLQTFGTSARAVATEAARDTEARSRSPRHSHWCGRALWRIRSGTQ